MKINYLVIPLIALATSLLGSLFTRAGMGWYKTISVPSWTPPGSVIGVVWSVIFVLSAISVLIVWNRCSDLPMFRWIIILFIVNALLNVLWSAIFFGTQNITGALVEMIILLMSVIALIILIFPHSRPAALLLVPYALWVGFATYLTKCIQSLNG